MSEEEIADMMMEIGDAIDDGVMDNATNEELMGYLFLVEKMKKKLEKMVNMEE